MTDQIYLDELECPNCNTDTFNDSWDIEVHPYKRKVTPVECEYCGVIFYVRTTLEVEVTKTDG